ncbi:hypothetical protein Ga0080574_TMP2816 [Salipiger abyssi]|uniref:Uncharacterized protein n=1 Tax=Salipiger abyssi TaxID=1250539 RepID=A0A1P8UUT7_9RHOB|nr:hypothetical protein Ga0080574_TMP2816 [Salipiger abyssi]
MAQRFVTKFADWVIIGVIGFLAVAFVEPVRERALAIWNTPTSMTQISENLVNLSDRLDVVSVEVRRLKQPETVFEMSTYNTRPVEGYCVSGQPCTINVRIRRLQDALSCRIVPGSIQWGFINPRADTFVSARRMDRPSGRNVGVSWEDITIRLMTPPNLEPEAYFTFEAFYTECPGMGGGDDPISFNSPRDLFEIRAE